MPLYPGIYQEAAPETVYPTRFRPAGTTADFQVTGARTDQSEGRSYEADQSESSSGRADQSEMDSVGLDQ